MREGGREGGREEREGGERTCEEQYLLTAIQGPS